MSEITSQITAVQVYRRGATVFRRAEVPLTPAVEDLELVDLPLSLLDPTVRVRVLAVEPAGAEVVAAGVRVGLWVRPGDPPPKAPEQKELEEVDRALQGVREQLDEVERELSLLASVPVPERPSAEEGKPPPPSPMGARLQLESFIDEATRQRLEERRKLRDKARELSEQMLRIEERIRASSTAAQVKQSELVKSAVVRLRASGPPATRMTVELSYVVPGARWAPAYQCKLSRDGSKAEIQLRAWIAQRTGEDWKGVKLRLSTASPLSFTELPQLSSIRIGRAQPAASKKGFRAPPSGAELLYRDHDRDLEMAARAVPARAAFAAPAFDLGVTRTQPPRPSSPPAERRMMKKAARMDDEKSVVLGRAEAGAPMDAMEEQSDLLMGDMDDGVERESDATPPPMRAPAPAAVSYGSGMERARSGPGGAKGGRSSVPDEVIQSMLYPLLRLPSASERGVRNRLVPQNPREAYLSSASRRGRPVPFDVMAVVQRAEQEAMAVQSASLPDGCTDADDISSHFDFAYEADGLVEVIGDGGFHSVALGDRSSEARMRYIAVPREEAAVYRVAMLTNPVPAPLLPGPAELYVGGEYVLTTRLPTVPARGELKLGLGVEQAIKVARNTKYQEVRSGEKVVAMTELVHDVDIDVVNHLERDIDLEVRERVPVPAPGAEVVIEESDVKPAWQPYDQEERGQPIDGGRRWEIKIAGGQTTQLHARYTVKIYANNDLVGGNRREA